MPAEQLRAMFNRLYLAEMRAGRITELVVNEGPANPRYHQPPGTRSQVAHLFDSTGRKVAVVHQYKLPDDSLGGSGKPDPKNVLGEDGQLYALCRKEPPPGKRRRKRGGKGKKKKRGR